MRGHHASGSTTSTGGAAAAAEPAETAAGSAGPGEDLRGRSLSNEPQDAPTSSTAANTNCTVQELNELLFGLHPPLVYNYTSASRRPSPGPRSRAGSRAASHPSSRAASRAPSRGPSRASTPVPPSRVKTPPNLNLEPTTMPSLPTIPCDSELLTRTSNPPTPTITRTFGSVFQENVHHHPKPRRLPLNLHPPIVLSPDFEYTTSEPLVASPTTSTHPFDPPTEVDATEVDSNDDEPLDLTSLPSTLLQFRRAASNERYNQQTKMGRIYRKVRLRRSKDQMRAKQRMTGNPERSVSGDSYLVPTHAEQRPPRYTRKTTPDVAVRGVRNSKGKSYQTPPAGTELGEMVWSPNTSPNRVP